MSEQVHAGDVGLKQRNQHGHPGAIVNAHDFLAPNGTHNPLLGYLDFKGPFLASCLNGIDMGAE